MNQSRPLSRPWLRRPLTATAILSLMGTQGCFTYVATDPGASITEGERRVVLHPEASRRLSQEWNRDLPYLEGRIVELTADSVAVSVRVAGWEHRGTPFEHARQVLAVPRSEVLEFQERQLSTGRTALLAGGIGLTLALVITQLFDVTGGGSGNGNGTGDPAPSLVPR